MPSSEEFGSYCGTAIVTVRHLHPLPEFQLPCLVALGTETQPNTKEPNTRVRENKQMVGRAREPLSEEAR